MAQHSYEFADRWVVHAERDRVYDVLADLGGYPDWWPQVRSVRRIDDVTAAVECRSALPYVLRLTLRATRDDRAAGVLQADVHGDLDGWCRWTVTAESPEHTVCDFAQVVRTRAPLLRRLGSIGRPVLELNHAWMMRGGRRGMARECEPVSRPRFELRR